MLDTLKRRTLIESAIPPVTWPEQNEKLAQRLREDIEYWQKLDPIQVVKKNLHGSAGDTPSAFFDRAPILCGLILFRFCLLYQQTGLTLVNAWGMVVSSAHLYLACKLYDRLPGNSSRLKSWPDMDLVMSLHGEQDICGGHIIKTVEDANIAFLTMMGYANEAAQLASIGANNGQPRASNNQAGAKGIADHSAIIPMFKHRYLSNKRADSRLDITLVQALLTVLKSDARQSPSQTVSFRHERRHRASKFSTVQLLAIVETGLRLETVSLRFDYISMHLRCIQVLKSVQAASHEYLSRKIGSKYIENESQLPYVVGYILQWATASGKVAASLGMRGGASTAVGSKLLLGAVKALNEYLGNDRDASVEVKRVAKLKV
jgi:hypothetical protein